GFALFTADVGLDDEVGNAGSVVFQVFLDNSTTAAFDSTKMTGATATKHVSVDLTGHTQIKLVVTDAGDNMNSDHADWADAQFVPPAAPIQPPAIPTLNNPTIVNNQINLSWSEPASNQTGFKIERKLGAGGTYAQIGGNLSGTTFSFVDTTAV